MEGIFNPNDLALAYNNEPKLDEKIILYTGTLAYRYGILDLIKALSLQNPLYRLVICGDGDSKQQIIEYTQIDSRIIYKGVLERSEILHLQQNAYLLVNPRTPDGEYTKYSISTKIPEYLRCCKPIIAVGPKDIASIEYLENNDAAIVIDHFDSHTTCRIQEVLSDQNICDRIAGNAYRLFQKNHRQTAQQQLLREKLSTVVNKNAE